jgi:hypothetical protein
MQVLNDLCSDIESRSLTGGAWAYGELGAAAVEPTCLALLALNRRDSAVRRKAVGALLSNQSSDGSWPAFITGDREAFWATALAVITLNRLSASPQAVDKAVHWLLKAKGREGHWFWKWKYRTVDRRVRFDPDKYGWSWVPGTVSWVVPTAFALIALKQSQVCCSIRKAEVRVRLGIEMLMDRRCTDGGWNAGNASVDGASLPPHIDTTAIALLAIDDAQSLHWLRRVAPQCNSLYSWAWSVLAFLRHGTGSVECDFFVKRLDEYLALGSARLNIETLALAALVLDVLHSGQHPFDWRNK